VAGCLRAAAASPTGTSGAAATPPATTDAAGKADAANADAKFVLANAVPSSADTSATTTASNAPQTYQLIANGSALTPHVGKKLELTGTIEDESSAAPSAKSESSASSTTASAANGPKLRVQSGKVVGETCTP
jgi:hypothetical protein